VKIAHFQVKERSGRRTMTLTRVLEGLKGVAGVVAVRSMGLITVLYDEQRTDPLAISGEIARQAVDGEADEPGSEPELVRVRDSRTRTRRRKRQPRPVTLGTASLQR
jgi:hypothetical protein